MRASTQERIKEYADRLNTEANHTSALGRTDKQDILGRPSDTDLLMQELSPNGQRLLKAVQLRTAAQVFWMAAGVGGFPILNLADGSKIDLRMTGRRSGDNSDSARAEVEERNFDNDAALMRDSALSGLRQAARSLHDLTNIRFIQALSPQIAEGKKFGKGIDIPEDIEMIGIMKESIHGLIEVLEIMGKVNSDYAGGTEIQVDEKPLRPESLLIDPIKNYDLNMSD